MNTIDFPIFCILQMIFVCFFNIVQQLVRRRINTDAYELIVLCGQTLRRFCNAVEPAAFYSEPSADR